MGESWISPMERIPASPRAAWSAGMVLVILSSGIAFGSSLTFVGVYPAMRSPAPILYDILLIVVIELALLLYIASVPMPAPELVVTPEALELHHGLRTERAPWNRVGVFGSRLVLVPRRWGFTVTHALDRFQAERLSRFAGASPAPAVRPVSTPPSAS